MRWRPTRIGDTTPQLNRCCGVKPTVLHDLASTQIFCPRCRATATSKTQPFLSDAARQREHQTWRAAEAWNNPASRQC
ncbi:hypothetical protein HFN54_13130 [Rhizobium leguminosarum]|nr:hypothetical protein [Rhizobium leguminosarum]